MTASMRMSVCLRLTASAGAASLSLRCLLAPFRPFALTACFFIRSATAVSISSGVSSGGLSTVAAFGHRRGDFVDGDEALVELAPPSVAPIERPRMEFRRIGDAKTKICDRDD